MRRPATATRGQWWKFTRYVLSDGYIKPAPGARLEKYDPWRGFRLGPPRAKERRGGKGTRAPHGGELAAPRIYEQFCNLLSGPPTWADPRDPLGHRKDAVLAWCAKYGLLGILPQQTRLITLPARALVGPPKGIKVEGHLLPGKTQTIYWQTPAGWTGEVRDALGLGEEPDTLPPHAIVSEDGRLREEPLDRALAPFFPGLSEQEKMQGDYPLPFSKKFWKIYCEPAWEFRRIVMQFKTALMGLSTDLHGLPVEEDEKKHLFRYGLRKLEDFASTVRPVLRPIADSPFSRGSHEISWVAGSFLGTLAIMAILDLSEGRRMATCSAGGCGALFVTSSYQGLFCSSTCANRERKRRQRARAKKTLAKVVRKPRRGRR